MITADFTPSDTANYNSRTGVAVGNFVIQPAPTTTTVTCTGGPFTYTGSAFTPCTASVSGPGGLSETPAVLYADNIDAGTASASASYEGSANYEASSDTEAFTIDKAPTATVVTCAGGPFVYTGLGIEPCTAVMTRGRPGSIRLSRWSTPTTSTWDGFRWRQLCGEQQLCVLERH